MAGDAKVVRVEDLDGGENSEVFNGHEHGGPAQASPHKFTSRGEAHRQISIHPAARMETEWLE